MQNNFLKHFAIIGSGTLINMFLGFFSTLIITRIVEPIKYGQLSIFIMYSNIATMVLCLGLDQTLVRYYYEKDNISYKRALLFRCITIPVIISIILSCIIFFLLTQNLILFEFNILLTILLCLYTIIQIIYRFSLLVVRLDYKSKLYSVLNIANKLTYIFFSLFLILFLGNDDLFSLVVATIMGVFICMVISIVTQKSLWSISKYKTSDCDILNAELFKYAYPYIFTMGITTLFQAIDKISLNIYCSYNEVGIYSSAMTLVNIFAIIQTTFNSLWTPMSIEHYTNNKKDTLFYQKGNQIITFIMFFLGISLIFFKDIFVILLGGKYQEAAYILPFLIFNPIMYTISETTVCGIVFMKKSKLQVVIALGACMTNLLGNTILVPRYGCQGAAISTGISYIVFFTLRTIFSNRFFFIDYSLKKFYLLTLNVALYAFYNTFNRFNLGAIIGYFICLIILFILYKDIVKWGINYTLNLIQSYIKKLE